MRKIPRRSTIISHHESTFIPKFPMNHSKPESLNEVKITIRNHEVVAKKELWIKVIRAELPLDKTYTIRPKSTISVYRELSHQTNV